MRFTGRLTLPDVRGPGLDIECQIDGSKVIVRRCGSVVGTSDLSACALEHTAGRRFVLKLGGESFSFDADDPLRVLHEAIPSFAVDARPKRWRPRPASRETAPEVHAASALRHSIVSLAAPATEDVAAPRQQRRKRRRRRKEPFPGQRRELSLHGTEVFYFDVGVGPPVVFLDGGIAGLQLWRDLLGSVVPHARCIGLDLVGTGLSGPLPSHEQQSWGIHARFLDALLEDLGITGGVTFVVHGWGSLIAYEWMLRNEQRLTGFCHIDALLLPPSSPEVKHWHVDVLRDAEAMGRPDSAIEPATCVARLLGELVNRPLPPGAVAELLQPFEADIESRTLQFALTSLPLEGGSTASVELVERGWRWLTGSDIPKLMVTGQPGFFLQGQDLTRAMELPNQTVAAVEGKHLLPLEAPGDVGRFIALWLARRR